MKLYAQHGYGDGQRTVEGVEASLLDGIIFSPRDISKERLIATSNEARTRNASIELLFDPQFYACIIASDPAANTGRLGEDYEEYFQPRRRSQLLSEKQVIKDLDNIIRFQSKLPITGIIAPNILIPRSFDSTESAISMDFIRNTNPCFLEHGIRMPIYATLAIGRDTLLETEELLRFLNDITILDSKPTGFYILIATNSTEAKTDVYHTDVIAGWMLINHVLNINGFQVINGYSDILSPFLGAAGGYGGATGWWSNLRSFSMERFAPPLGGGRLPNERYLSCKLINRIAFYELELLRDLEPEILNGLPTDILYPTGSSQPDRRKEVLQSWDAVKKLITTLVTNNQVESLEKCARVLEYAQRLYERVNLRTQLETKSNNQHLEPLKEGIVKFKRLAEL